MEDLIEIMGDNRICRTVIAGHFRIADYRPEDFVEVVGDASGQGADGLHLLGVLVLREEGLSPDETVVDPKE